MLNMKSEPFLNSLLLQDILVGLLRLRKCGRNVTCPELVGKCSIVRELHVYGTAVPVHGRDADKLQHQVIIFELVEIYLLVVPFVISDFNSL